MVEVPGGRCARQTRGYSGCRDRQTKPVTGIGHRYLVHEMGQPLKLIQLLCTETQQVEQERPKGRDETLELMKTLWRLCPSSRGVYSLSTPPNGFMF